MTNHKTSRPKSEDPTTASTILPDVWIRWARAMVIRSGLPHARTPDDIEDALDILTFTVEGTTSSTYRDPLRCETRRVLRELEDRGVSRRRQAS
jgi:hypothetical protein